MQLLQLLPTDAFRIPCESPVADEGLLARFRDERDQEAFTELVRRYSGLVYGVSVRVLGSGSLAEEATQATFLVLARRPPVLDGRSLAAWLHGVAYKSALFARRTEQRRRRHEQRAARTEVVIEERPCREELGLLDQELTRLSEEYRLPLVLCFLRGCSHRQAARELGCPVGTIASRISRGKALLRTRLRRRGVAAWVIPTLLSGGAATAASPELVARCCAATSSDAVQHLATAVGRSMKANVWTGISLVLLLLGVAVVGSAWLAPSKPPETPTQEKPPEAAVQPMTAKGYLEGQFTDAKTGQPVEGVKVRVIVAGRGGGKNDLSEVFSGKDGRYRMELPIGHAWLFGVMTPAGYYIQDTKTYSNFATTPAEPRMVKSFEVHRGPTWQVKYSLPKEELQQSAWFSAQPVLEGDPNLPRLRSNNTEAIYNHDDQKRGAGFTLPATGGKWKLVGYVATTTGRSIGATAQLDMDADFDPSALAGPPEKIAGSQAVRLKDQAGRSATIEGVEVTVAGKQAVLHYPLDKVAGTAEEFVTINLTGTVADEAGKPIDEGLCTMVFRGARSGATSQIKTTTNKEGKFHFADLKLEKSRFSEDTNFSVMVTRSGYVGATTGQVESMEVLQNGKAVFEKIVLKKGHVLRGRVVDEEDKPVFGAVVTNNSRYFETAHLRCRTDEQGRFAIADQEYGEMRLDVNYGEQGAHQKYQFQPDAPECILVVKPIPGMGRKVDNPPAKKAAPPPVEKKEEETWDLTPPRREPAYQGKPVYALFVFGEKHDRRVWLVLDGHVLYVDRNGDGDLTGPGERITATPPAKDENKFANAGSHTHFDVLEFEVESAPGKKSRFVVNHWIRDEKYVPKEGHEKEWHADWLKHRHENTSVYRKNGLGQGQTPVVFMPKPADAQVVAFDGPLTLTLKMRDQQILERGLGGSDVPFHIVGKGRTPPASPHTLRNCLATTEVHADAYLEVEAEFPNKVEGEPPIKRKYLLKERC